MLAKESQIISMLERGELLSSNEQRNSPCDPLVPHLLHTYENRFQDGTLFGITGDLDDLGVYVARNGRARAEVLIDFYNQVIRKSVMELILDHGVTDICLAPTGEEVFCLGITAETETARTIFFALRPKVMEAMKSQDVLDIEMTAASFGGEVFADEYDNVIHSQVTDHIRGY